ncbi:MAG: 5-methyltetrahydropteroyltriglutamate--homocysteine S-methyltransferase [Betaproteobacteria bacterium]|nr:5-methyltetrahydropteroyltriglutamate--homocysteine S-methyltransferase [Betaproteobacteria bacterium]
MKPPFRADQVGSLLRPAELHDARAKAKRGEISAAKLREAEDSAIRDAVARQEAVGLQSITDGEFRRDWWHVDFLAGFDGVESYAAPLVVGFKNTEEQPLMLRITGKVRRTRPVFVDSFKFMKQATLRTAKQTIPAPAMLHMRPGRAGISRKAYPDLEEFWRDVAQAYRAEIRDLAAAGCTYLQLDDTSFAYLCDEKFRASMRERGDDPDQLVRTYAAALSAAVAERPPGMAITMHTCRGNFKSTWVASGGYEPVVEALFSAAVDGFFMEFDSDRAGDFAPLRFVPKGKKVVLGLVTTKQGQLEDKETLKRRIDAAAKYVPLEDLCVSPQCGFSSTHHGNALSHEEQWRKLERIVEVAGELWR